MTKVERLAAALAECCNGGTWATHADEHGNTFSADYTERQKDLWRARAEKVMLCPRDLDFVGAVGAE